MTATLYRISAVLLVLFAAGHTFGFIKFKAPTAEGQALRASMDSVKMEVEGKTYTYGGFYQGFGLMLTAYLLFLAVLAWHMGTLAGANQQAIGMLGWAFVVVLLVTLGLSLKYFVPPPAILSGVLTVLLAWAALALKK